MINRFVNVKHPLITRLVFGVLLAILTLVATMEWRLAREMFRRAYTHDQFRKAFRRASFYARRSWLNINVSRDLVFVFCSDLTVEELLAQRRFLLRRVDKYMPGLIASDLSYVSAMLTIQTVGHSSYDDMLQLYREDGEKVLKAIENTPADLPTLPEEKDRASFDIENAAVALADFADFMEQYGFAWFVLSGTLLGIVRENGFLKHDYDIDVGVMGEQIDLHVLERTLKKDPRFRCDALDEQVIFSRDKDGKLSVALRPVFMKVSHQGGIHLDIFVHYTDENVCWHASPLFRWDNSVFDLVQYTLADTKVLGPADADRYLTENYGDWRVPKVDFNSALDTTNQQVVQNPLSVAIFMRRIWVSQVSNPRGAEWLKLLLKKNGFVKESSVGQTRFSVGPFET